MGGGTEPIGEVWFTGTVPAECSNDAKYAMLTATDLADPQAYASAHDDYTVMANGVELLFHRQAEGAIELASADNKVIAAMTYPSGGCEFIVYCPTDISGTVEVTVAKK